jgi:hypothetical protein
MSMAHSEFKKNFTTLCFYSETKFLMFVLSQQHVSPMDNRCFIDVEQNNCIYYSFKTSRRFDPLGLTCVSWCVPPNQTFK